MKKITTEVFDGKGNLISRETITEGEKLKPLRAHILIDNSSSMQGSEFKVVSGVNEYVATLKNKAETDGLDIFVSVSFFSSAGPWSGRYSILTIQRPKVRVNAFIPMTLSEIKPLGSTPLYDAIGDTVWTIGAESVNEDVALVILTDGEENASTRFTATSIRELLAQKKAENWAVIYLGANQDAWAVGGHMGTSKHHTATYNMASMDAAFVAAAGSTMRYAGTRSLESSQFTEAELSSMVTKK